MVKCINSSAHFTDIYSRKETLTITSTSTHHGMMETEQGQQKKKLLCHLVSEEFIHSTHDFI
jgi:hypothetical protein